MTQGDPTDDQLLHLAQAGLSTRAIARVLPLSQSTVSRRLSRITAGERAEQARKIAVAVMLALLTACALVTAAALATMAWRH